MVGRRSILLGGLALAGLLVFRGRGVVAPAMAESFEIEKTAEEWRRILTPQQFAVLRQESTEAPFTSPLNDEHREGRFVCAGCELPLFSSATKFDSRTGWPSFWEPLPKAIGTRRDYKLVLPRTEVHCRRCGGHLGHVFDDGPKPTGLRYCMNGVAMTFVPKAAA
ncbi:peptide-methionine (R)-S-oxide reductase MsrB [Terrihabitans sp. B22-R8]|uniref:peptide-methionine (R)-S-oxide reductase MsrB n=1 Tax=Terrihabitans sp. B22-R8 TaxID=3425128 RepID=UPI00403C7409